MDNKLTVHNTILIVDPQNDFIEDGSLAVKGGKKALNNLINYIMFNRDYLGDFSVYTTMDNHPANHSSFKKCGGMWPEHCVQGSHGNEIYKQLEEVLENLNKCNYFTKGNLIERDEYSIFKSINGQLLENNLRSEKSSCDKFNIIVCGIAGDYCVLNTIKDLIDLGYKENICVLLRGIASIDGGKALNELIIKENLNIL